MGRRKVSMETIEDLHMRQICFSKRRKGLFRKANALCNKGGGEVAIVLFSSAGNLYCYGSSTVDSIVHRYFERRFVSAMVGDDGGGKGDGDVQWWDVPVEGLVLHELEVLHRMLGDLKEKVVLRTASLLVDKYGEDIPEEASRVYQQSSDSRQAMEDTSSKSLRSLELPLKPFS